MTSKIPCVVRRGQCGCTWLSPRALSASFPGALDPASPWTLNPHTPASNSNLSQGALTILSSAHGQSFLLAGNPNSARTDHGCGAARGLPTWGRAPPGGVTSPARRGRGLRSQPGRALAGVEAAAPALGERPRPGRARGPCGARRCAFPRRFRPRRLVAAAPGLWREGRCHSPSPRRPGSCVAGAAVSSARPAAAADPARPPSPSAPHGAFPARGPARARGLQPRPRSPRRRSGGPGVRRVCGG